MKLYLITFFFIGLMYSCIFSTDNQNNNTKQNQTKIHLVNQDKDKTSYLELKKMFDQGYYLDLNRQISQFYEYNKESRFLDSVKQIEKNWIENKNKNKKLRDSFFRYSSLREYINLIGITRLDSITYSSYDINHLYTKDFFDFDKKMINTDWDENWYISKQLSGKFICLSVAHFRDCEFKIVLYSLDDKRKVIDSKEVFNDGCFAETDPNFRYKNFLVNEGERYNASYFHGDSTFTRVIREYFCIKDTITNKEYTEVGFEYNVTFKIDSLGKFREVNNKSFEKDYFKPLFNSMY